MLCFDMMNNDSLVQFWAKSQRSIYSGKYGCVGHHIIRRDYSLLRWDLQNIAPLTPEEHRLLHDGKIKLTLPEDRREYLHTKANIRFKDYLLENNLTKQEFTKSCHDALILACQEVSAR